MKNTDKIQVLSDRQQARTKLPVFYGSRDNYLHGFREVVSNAIDEIINNFDKGNIDVQLKNNVVSVMDSGRGLPIQNQDDEVLLFEKMFAGTKYDETDNITTGTNGVGNTVLNYTSIFFKATVYTKNEILTIGYTDGGKNKQKSIQENTTPIKHGTRIEFELDPECYTQTIFEEEDLKDIIKHYAAITPQIEFSFNGERFYYDTIDNYLIDNIEKPLFKPYIFSKTIELDDGEKNTYNIVFTSNAEPLQETYLNNTHLIENGSIYNGFIKELTNSLNSLAIDKKLHKKTKKKDNDFTEEDIKKVISFVVDVQSNRVEFAAQTKFSTKKVRYNAQTKAVVKEMLNLFANAREKEFKELVKVLDTVHQRTTKANKVDEAIKETLKKKVDNINNKVEGLIDCRSHKDSELYIVEGRSALGSVVQARNPENQAAFPLRGKALNAWDLSTSKALENKEMAGLVKAIGAGAKNTHNNKNEVDILKARYKKIIIATDADADGYSIASSLISFFKRFIPEIIENEMLYIVQTPLYLVSTETDEVYYIYSEGEKEKILNNIQEKYNIVRFKGLGEISPKQMAEVGMGSKRILKLIKDDNEGEQTLENWFGKDSEIRKKMILS